MFEHARLSVDKRRIFRQPVFRDKCIAVYVSNVLYTVVMWCGGEVVDA